MQHVNRVHYLSTGSNRSHFAQTCDQGVLFDFGIGFLALGCWCGEDWIVKTRFAVKSHNFLQKRAIIKKIPANRMKRKHLQKTNQPFLFRFCRLLYQGNFNIPSLRCAVTLICTFRMIIVSFSGSIDQTEVSSLVSAKGRIYLQTCTQRRSGASQHMTKTSIFQYAYIYYFNRMRIYSTVQLCSITSLWHSGQHVCRAIGRLQVRISLGFWLLSKRRSL